MQSVVRYVVTRLVQMLSVFRAILPQGLPYYRPVSQRLYHGVYHPVSQRFYRYHKLKSLRAGSEAHGPSTAVPYWHIFKKTFPQLLNVFLVFFVTLSVFPTVLAGQSVSVSDVRAGWVSVSEVGSVGLCLRGQVRAGQCLRGQVRTGQRLRGQVSRAVSQRSGQGGSVSQRSGQDGSVLKVRSGRVSVRSGQGGQCLRAQVRAVSVSEVISTQVSASEMLPQFDVIRPCDLVTSHHVTDDPVFQ